MQNQAKTHKKVEWTVFEVIGYNVARLAKARGWNDEALAVHSGVSRTTASKVIRGRAVQTAKQRAIMAALDAPWDEFVRPIPKDGATRVYLHGRPSLSILPGGGTTERSQQVLVMPVR